jgi:hypothetical protein
MVLAITTTALTACTTVKILDGMEVHCPRSPAGKITAKDGELSVNDNMIKICRGDSVQFTFKDPAPAANAARTLPKNAANGWLMAIYDGETITINVPGNIMPTEPNGPGYGYIIEVDGIGRLDPRLVVQ